MASCILESPDEKYFVGLHANGTGYISSCIVYTVEAADASDSVTAV
jgi:hypothetical protein